MKLIELSKQGYKHKCKYFAIVDDMDFDSLNKYRWNANIVDHTVYAMRSENGKKIFMHRQILGLINPKLDADHEDRNGLNNQRYNLRISTRSQNASNKRKHKNVTSNYYGVSFQKERNKYIASITKNYKQYNLGRFNTEQEAAIAYDIKAKELHGEFANLNFK